MVLAMVLATILAMVLATVLAMILATVLAMVVLAMVLARSFRRKERCSHQPDIFHKAFSNFLGSPITKPKFLRLETIFEIIVFQQLWKVEFVNFFKTNNQIMVIFFSGTYGLKGVV